MFEFLDRTLDPGWEIYLQPHLNGLRPDIVVLHPERGIGVLEVKDWNLDARNYEVHQRGAGHTLRSRSVEGGDWSTVRNPWSQVKAARDEIVDLYIPGFAVERPGRDAWRAAALVTATVIFTRASDAAVEDLLRPLLSGLNARYDRVAGREALLSERATTLLPDCDRESSWLMSTEIADGFRQWLDEPSVSYEQRQPLVLDTRQRELANARTASGFRRVRGPAGSGKTCVLAARALTLEQEDKRVLVVTFNVTLLNYIRDMRARLSPDAVPSRRSVTYLNFHAWCRRVIRQHGLDEEYRRLWREGHDRQDLDFVFSTDMAALAKHALQHPHVEDIYDAILVDEGQDLRPEWWGALRHALRDGGEMLLVADATQDVYGTAGRWTDERMLASGFSGPWNELASSYRLPGPALAVAREFAEEYLPTVGRQLPQPPTQQQLDVDPCRLRWVAVNSDSLAAALRQEIDDLLIASSEIEAGPGVHPADVVLLVDDLALGRAVVRLLRDDGVAVEDTFDADSRKARSQKRWFFKGDPRVKATTIHGFKGWEARAIVAGISRGKSASTRALVYTALTRVRHDPRGSYLSIVSAADELTAFGRTWPDFVELPRTERG